MSLLDTVTNVKTSVEHEEGAEDIPGSMESATTKAEEELSSLTQPSTQQLFAKRVVIEDISNNIFSALSLCCFYAFSNFINVKIKNPKKVVLAYAFNSNQQ